MQMKSVRLACTLFILTAPAFAQSVEDINRGIRERAAAAQQQAKKAPPEAPRPALTKWQQLAEQREGLKRAISSIQSQSSALEWELRLLDTSTLRGIQRQPEIFREQRELLIRRGDLEMKVIDIERSLRLHAAGLPDRPLDPCITDRFAKECQ